MQEGSTCFLHGWWNLPGERTKTMTQEVPFRHFCVQCGTLVVGETRTCASCRSASHAGDLQESGTGSERTTQVARSLVLQKAVREPPSAEVDEEKTVRAAIRLSSRDYSHASGQEFPEAPATEGGPSHTDPRLRLVKKGHALTLIHSKGRLACAAGVFLLLALLALQVLTAMGDPHHAPQVVQNKAHLDQLLVEARSIGVPLSLLRPVSQDERQLDSRQYSLFSLYFGDAQAAPHLAAAYQRLSARLPAIVAFATQQAQLRAQQDVQNFQTALTVRAGTDTGGSFSLQFVQDQWALANARTPKDYEIVSRQARESILALGMREEVQSQLADFQRTIMRLEGAHIDVTALTGAYQNDLQLFTSAQHAQDFSNLSALLDAQYQQSVVSSVQAFPYISLTELNELEMRVRQLKLYGVDAHDYEQRLNADLLQRQQARTLLDELALLKQIDTDVAAMHDVLVQGQARYLVRQFHQEVETWARQYPYVDRYDGHSYALDSGYLSQGIGRAIDMDLASATTTADFEAMVSEAQNALFNFHLLQADYQDHRPFDQVHPTDLAMLTHYGLHDRTVVLVSLVEQAMRVYQRGTLVRSFLVTTGRAALPSLPGVWAVLDRKSPVIFQSADPKGSPYWFPDTPISYAILYHWGGYFVHDAWWRASFGPGTQFPHLDAGGMTAYNFDGSHGCVNLAESDAAWVYHHTDWKTLIVIY